MYNKLPKYRYKKTLTMLKEILPDGGIIYDLGVRNPFSEIMEKEGYKVINSEGQDFDFEYEIEIPKEVDLVTGFEILEHLVSPFPLLKNLNCKRLFVTVPLSLWFSKAYKNKNDKNIHRSLLSKPKSELKTKKADLIKIIRKDYAETK